KAGSAGGGLGLELRAGETSGKRRRETRSRAALRFFLFLRHRPDNHALLRIEVFFGDALYIGSGDGRDLRQVRLEKLQVVSSYAGSDAIGQTVRIFAGEDGTGDQLLLDALELGLLHRLVAEFLQLSQDQFLGLLPALALDQ